jgi:predicted dehydrogenase
VTARRARQSVREKLHEEGRTARIGIIGAGFWAASFYLPFLRDLPGVEIVGVVRRDPDALRALRNSFPMEIATSDVDELLARGCEGVIVASPHTRHREHAEAALRAGAHVLIEKPMTVTPEDAQAVAQTAATEGRVVSLAYGWNYSPIGVWAADVADSGVLGELRSVSGHMASALVRMFSGEGGYGVVTLDGYDFEASPDTWARPGAGGGYLYGQLSHQLGLALNLVGSDPEVVYAQMGLLPNGVDIDVAVTVRFAGGVIGSFTGHGRLPWGTRYPFELRVAGTRGVMTLDFERERADVNLVDGANADAAGGRDAFKRTERDLWLEVADGDGIYTCRGPAQFLVDLCNGQDPIDRAPVQTGVRAVAIMDAALRSARLRRPVQLAAAA